MIEKKEVVDTKTAELTFRFFLAIFYACGGRDIKDGPHLCMPRRPQHIVAALLRFSFSTLSLSLSLSLSFSLPFIFHNGHFLSLFLFSLDDV